MCVCVCVFSHLSGWAWPLTNAPRYLNLYNRADVSTLNDVQWQRWYCVFYQCWLNVSCHSSSTLSATLTFMELPQIQSDTNTVSQMQQNNHPQLLGSPPPPLSSSFKILFLLIRSWEIYRKNKRRPKTGELTCNRHSSSFFFFNARMVPRCHGSGPWIYGLYFNIFCTYESRNNVPFPITVIYTRYSHFPTAIKGNVKEHFWRLLSHQPNTNAKELKIVFNSLAF